MKVNEPSKQMLDAHETCEQADTEIAKHQFGKESLYIICTLIHWCASVAVTLLCVS